MIKELCYEWVLLISNVLMLQKRQGFFDMKKLYHKKGWLDWEVIEITSEGKNEH